MNTSPTTASSELLLAVANSHKTVFYQDDVIAPRDVLLRAIDLVLQEKMQRAAVALALDSVSSLAPRGDIAAVLIKPVSDMCNLRCTYCYEGEGSNRVETGRMSLHLLEKIIADACEQANGFIDFLWHGGEPLLAGREFFEYGLRVQKRYLERGLRVRNAVQTNGLLLDDEWIKLFKRESFSVGISLDGPPFLHDPCRIDARGRGTSLRVERSLRQLQDAQVPFGVISVIDTRHVGNADTYLKYLMHLGVTNLDVHPSSQLKLGRLIGITPKEFSEFCINLFENWIFSGSITLRINLFDDFLRGYFGLNPHTCYFSGSCSKIVAVEASGDVTPCTRPFDRVNFTFGNLAKKSLGDVVTSISMRKFSDLDLLGQERAAECKWNHLCHAGCPQHRIDVNSTQRIDAGNLYCDCDGKNGGGYSSIWSHIASRLEEIVLRMQ